MRLFEYDYGAAITKLHSVYALVKRGATEGERSAAELAFKRLMDVITRDYGEEKAAQAEQQVKAAYGTKERTKTKPKSHYTYQEPPKKEPPRQKSKGPGAPYTYNGWTFTILRFTDPSAGKRGSDKVWGYAVNDGRVMTFWGRFGKTVSTKEIAYHEVNKKFRQKLDKGYISVDADPIDYGYIFTQSEGW